MVDLCYPDGADWLCAYTQAELDEMRADPDVARVMDRADALAWNTLSSLIGYRLSLCPIALRPCAARCVAGTWDEASVATSGGTFTPVIIAGQWFNTCGCSRDACGCTEIQQIIMPSPVGAVQSVRLAGAILDPTAYRVDNGNRLVRQDGLAWPVCQDMNLPADSDEAFVITYYPNLAPNDLLRYAAGVLAVEYFKSCNGGACRLPNGVTNISRNGISMEISSALFPGGATGLREVDPIIRIYNPNGLTMGARVLSPDSPSGRTPTYGRV